MSHAEDQHPVGDLGPHCQDEAFGEAVRPRTPRRDLDHLDASGLMATKSSAIALARGARIGVWMMRMSVAVKTASNAAANLASRSRINGVIASTGPAGRAAR